MEHMGVLPRMAADRYTDKTAFTLDYAATYAHPRRTLLVDELPRNATGNVHRYALEEMAENRLDEPLDSSDML
jgi:acyl-coenzyme A synthetase/AMP-(fatty) acid ligase